MYNLLILIAIIVLKVECHVINQSMDSKLNSEYIKAHNKKIVAIENKNVSDTKSVYRDKIENRLYLDDVIFALNNQNWTKEEENCRKQILMLLQNLQNFTLWAVWDWDTQSSEPQGLLFGNRYQLGNFDQCMNSPWADTHKELRRKYCLADIVLERTIKNSLNITKNHFSPYQSTLEYIEYRPPHTRPLNELTWGMCVPESCGAPTVERLLEVMLARSHLGVAGMSTNIKITEPCQKYNDHKEFDTLFYAFFGLIGLLTVLCLICTYLNYKNKEPGPDTLRCQIVKAFCLKENATDLLKVQKGRLEVLYGIRFLTICLIVLDHQLGIYNAGPISDGYTSDQIVKTMLGHLILHDDLFVDTFFFLSGFLTLTAFVRFKKFPCPVIIIVKRYVRLVVALAVVVFYMCAVFPYTGSGPLWQRAVTQESDHCRKNWWLNILMVNNYINTENICLVISWYIPCDFHFCVLTILLFWLYKHIPRLGFACFTIVGIVSLVLPGILNYVNNLSAVQLFTFEFVVNPRGNKEYHLTYIKSHTRFAAYMVGVYAAFVYTKFSAKEDLTKIYKKWALLGVLSALTLMLVVMITGSAFLWRDYHPIEGAIYAALNRPAWAFGVALFVLCCSFGRVPVVKSLLTWYPWVPLSRLSYGLYLTHSIIITRNVFVTRNPQHNDYFEILNTTAGVIFWGSIAALVLWLLAEAPANKLLAMLLKPRTIECPSNDDKINDKPQISPETILGVNDQNYCSKM
ncbi:hypothetical protein K1T71_010832 [Dendrolimus kikuchii]|uniref:Uncharacterized protein n=1 Tax=Dendrolimus kikuchii TaxID=765133 RepID=A0ACC1CQ68_9NEOP|nr:hypothetical protein K1T71_010832 [Dendrolimus kikuchii]